MQKLRLAVLLMLFFWVNTANASGINSADLSYRYISAGKYEVTLQLIYPCESGVPSDFQQVVVFEAFGNKAFPPLQLKLISSENKSLSQPAVCSQQISCVMEAVYKSVIELMPLKGGYNITWGSCCIQDPLVNINMLTIPGFKLISFIPGPEVAEKNSMPDFMRLPQTGFCVKKISVLNETATDADGDSLAYEIQSPYQADKQKGMQNNMESRPAILLPEPPPYSPIDYAGNFSAREPLGKNGVTLNPQNGAMEIELPLTGHFLFGYCIKEYRQGKLLSIHQRVILLTAYP